VWRWRSNLRNQQSRFVRNAWPLFSPQALAKENPVNYLPPYEIIKGMMNLTTARGKTRVDMTYEDMQKLIRTLLISVEVDEAFYLERNQDVADGIRAGNIRSAREHFVDHGYFEGRLPYRIEVDEEWYLQTHQDVAETVRQGQYESGQAHFDGPGYPEGREPFAADL
jgi:hypothetical protein